MMTRKEWAWVLAWSLLTLLLANLPYLLGWAISTPQNRFGGLYFLVEDGNSYLAKMRHAAVDGSRYGWRYYLPYSHEPQAGAFGIVFLYTVLGKGLGLVTSRVSVSGLLAAYHGARVLAGLALLLSAYRFAVRFVEGTMRRLAFLLAVFAPSLGWLLAFLGWFAVGNVPLEFWSPDAFLLPILSGPPHIILALAMLLAAMLAMLKAWQTQRWYPALIAAVLAVALTLIRPHYVLIFDAVLAAAWCAHAWRERRASWLRARQLLPALLLPLPLFLYLFLVLNHDPVLQQWTLQNPFGSPPPWHYLAGYGLLFIPALWGLRRRGWWQENGRWFLLLWLALVPIMAYAPVPAQRRLIGGAVVPLAIAAARGLWREKQPRNWPAWIWLALTLPSTLFFVLGGTLMVRAQPPLLFHQPGELAALDWLSEHTTTSDVILAATESGNLIPVHADARVLVGHPIETIQFEQKKDDVAAFFDPATPEEQRWEILRRYGITLVFYGPWEQELGQFDPRQMAGLKQVYAEGRYQVFQVPTDSLP
jgi:hypothetical protein